jgi:hypothetical protein
MHRAADAVQVLMIESALNDQKSAIKNDTLGRAV